MKTLVAVFLLFASMAFAGQDSSVIERDQTIHNGILRYLSEYPVGRKVRPGPLGVMEANPEDPRIRYLKDHPLFSFPPTYLDRGVNLPIPPGPVIDTTFNGLLFGTSISPGAPPDTQVAVGAYHVLEALNSGFQMFERNGSPTTSPIPFCGPDGFFTPVIPSPSGSDNCTDPKVIVDPYTGRFILLDLLVNVTGHRSFYLVAVTDGADNGPPPPWIIYALDASVDVASPTNNWADFPGLGIDSQAIYITSNQYDFATSTFQYGKLRILVKSKIYAHNSSWTDIVHPFGGTFPFRIQPTITYENSGYEYFVSVDAGSGSTINVWYLSNPANSTPDLAGGQASINPYSIAPAAKQCSVTTGIDTGYANLLNAVYRQGRIWTVHSVACGGGDSCLRFISIDPGVGVPSVKEDFTYGASGFAYYYPDIQIDSSGNLFAVFNRSSSSECAGLRYTGRPAGQEGGPTSSIATLQLGATSYVLKDSTGKNRFGDYSGAAVDPAVSGKVWVAGEYVPTKNKWGTYIAELEYPPDFGITCSPNSVAAQAGQSAGTNCSVTSVSAFSNSVDLSCSNLPAGASCGFTPSSVTPPANSSASSSLNVSLASNVVGGDYSFNVVGNTALGGTHMVPVALHVQDYTASCVPATITIPNGGGTSKSACTFTPAGGYTGTVSLICNGLPSGASCSLSQDTLDLSAGVPVTSTITVTTDSSVGSGTYPFNVSASGAVSHNVQMELDVVDAIFSDTFNDGNYTSPAWTVKNGTWSASTGDAVGTVTKKGDLVSPAFSCTVCTFEANVKVQATGRISLFTWYQSSKSNLEVRLMQDKQKLFVKQKGAGLTAKDSISLAIAPDTFYNVKALYNGSKIQVFINDVLTVTLTPVVIPSGSTFFRVKSTTGVSTTGTLADIVVY